MLQSFSGRDANDYSQHGHGEGGHHDAGGHPAAFREQEENKRAGNERDGKRGDEYHLASAAFGENRFARVRPLHDDRHTGEFYPCAVVKLGTLSAAPKRVDSSQLRGGFRLIIQINDLVIHATALFPVVPATRPG
jgi:hypothetical protein